MICQIATRCRQCTSPSSFVAEQLHQIFQQPLRPIIPVHPHTNHLLPSNITIMRHVISAAPRAAATLTSTTIRPTARLPIALTRSSTPSISRSYHEKVLDHYSSPRNVGSLSKSDTSVGTGLVGAPACGDVMKLQIKVNPDTERIEDVKFKTFGCGSAIASSSYLTELVRGMTLGEAGKVRNTEIARELCLPPVKCECLSSVFLVCRFCVVVTIESFDVPS